MVGGPMHLRRRKQFPSVLRVRNSGRRLCACKVLGVRARFSGSVLVQRQGCVPVVQYAPHGRDRGPSGRSRLSESACAAVGAVFSEALALLPARAPALVERVLAVALRALAARLHECCPGTPASGCVEGDRLVNRLTNPLFRWPSRIEFCANVRSGLRSGPWMTKSRVTKKGRLLPSTAFWADSPHCTTMLQCVRQKSAMSGRWLRLRG